MFAVPRGTTIVTSDEIIITSLKINETRQAAVDGESAVINTVNLNTIVGS